MAPIKTILLDKGDSTSAVSLYRRKAVKALLSALSAELGTELHNASIGNEEPPHYCDNPQRDLRWRATEL